jgi:hypothetical protein
VANLKAAASVRRTPEPQVLLFQNKQDSPEAARDLLVACGEAIWLLQEDWHHEVWNRKLVLDNSGVGEQFNKKLQSGQFSTYKSLVESFSGAVERLVALHLSNALIYNRVPCKDAQQVNVLEWPCTCDLATGKEPYSILPLLGAYCERNCWESFPESFACYAMNSVKCGRADVAKKLAEVIVTVSS